ncbi:hypothetical protein B566_EDAN011166 [Ephemera danica]|nr:hypothetical protein B566_EDAN011166 [Ephemera danica]
MFRLKSRGNAVSAATAASAAANAATTASMPSSSNTTVSAPPPALPLNPAPVTTATLPPELGRMVPIQITLPPTPGSGETQPRVLNIQVPAAALQGNQLHSILSGPIMTATLALPAHVASSLLQQHITAAFAGQAAATVNSDISMVQAQRNVPAQAPAQQVAQVCQSVKPVVAAGRGRGGGSFKKSYRSEKWCKKVTTTSILYYLLHMNDEKYVFQLDGVGDSSDDDLDDDIDDDDDDDDVDDDKEDSAGEDSGGQEEEPLNSGDDVSDEDVAEQFETDNVVVCQYDKVTRSRNKWKLYLKDGIMNLNGRDFVFQKANGDAEW